MPSSDRETSIWLPIDRIVPHPQNPNRMNDEQRAKLRRNIGGTGYYPPVIVRTLEVSDEFSELASEGMYQILDGEHRWLDQKDEGAEEIEVRVWKGITDARAIVLLGTLNRLHGTDDPAKRRALLRRIHDEEPDYEAIASILPETEKQIRKMIEEDRGREVGEAQQRAAELSAQEAVTIFASPSQASSIRSAIKRWLDRNDPDHEIEECREGHALAEICRSSAEASN